MDLTQKRRRGPSHHNWKGDKVGYNALHTWLSRHYGKPNKCEDCGVTTGRFEWANVSGKYLRDRIHWK